jgi:hypothetical protein
MSVMSTESDMSRFNLIFHPASLDKIVALVQGFVEVKALESWQTNGRIWNS